jgi:hypothetical protein
MAVTIDSPSGNFAGLVTAGAGPQDQRAARPGDPATPGNRVVAQGRLILAEDRETVLFQPVDQGELDDVIAAGEA